MHFGGKFFCHWVLGVCNVGVLSPDLNVLGLDKSEVSCSVFQLLLKNVPSQLALLQIVLCQIFAFFLTIVLVDLVMLLDFPCGGYDRCYILIDSNVVDFRECAYFTKVIFILV